MSSVELRLPTFVAVIAHEVPQETGDFAILIESGFSRARAICYNALPSPAAVPGALIAYFLLPSVEGVVPYLLSFSAASFVYIALADLVPGRRVVSGEWNLAGEIVLITLDAGTIVALR